MKIRLHRPLPHLNLQLTSKYYASGQQIDSLVMLRKYIEKDRDDNMWFVYNSDSELDMELLKKMVEMYPTEATLRVNEHNSIGDVKGFYRHNIAWNSKKGQANVRMLFEALKIYWTIMKFKNR